MAKYWTLILAGYCGYKVSKISTTLTFTFTGF